MFFTIGYQRFSLPGLIRKLDEHKIDLLIDVRTRPYSHNPQFCKGNLIHVLGDRYRWMGASLGGKSGVKKQGYNEALELLMNLSKTKNICVMCMEPDPSTCHRDFWIASDLKQRFNVDVKHLLNGKTEWELKNARAQTRLG